MPAFIGLIGVLVGGYITLASADITKKEELRNESYVNLVALKIPWIQSIQTGLEAQILSNFYQARHERISHDAEDLAQAKREYQRFLELIPRISDIQMEVFKNLAKVTIAYEIDNELESRINGIYSHHTVTIVSPPSDIKTDVELQKWVDARNSEIADFLKINFGNKFENLLPLLLKQLK